MLVNNVKKRPGCLFDVVELTKEASIICDKKLTFTTVFWV